MRDCWPGRQARGHDTGHAALRQPHRALAGTAGPPGEHQRDHLPSCRPALPREGGRGEIGCRHDPRGGRGVRRPPQFRAVPPGRLRRGRPPAHGGGTRGLHPHPCGPHLPRPPSRRHGLSHGRLLPSPAVRRVLPPPPAAPPNPQRGVARRQRHPVCAHRDPPRCTDKRRETQLNLLSLLRPVASVSTLPTRRRRASPTRCAPPRPPSPTRPASTWPPV